MEFLNSAARPAATGRGGTPSDTAKVVIAQATASILQTTRERFATAQAMLEEAHAGDPDNVDLAVALAALQNARRSDGLVQSDQKRGRAEQRQVAPGARLAVRARFYSGARCLLPLAYRHQPVLGKPREPAPRR